MVSSVEPPPLRRFPWFSPAGFAYFVAATGLPFLIARLHTSRFDLLLTQGWQKSTMPAVSLGQCVGLVVGMLVGLRSGRLSGVLLGPTLGYGIGWLDIRMGFLLACADGWLGNLAPWIPVWGLLAGLGLALMCPRPRAALALLSVGIAADFVGRCAGGYVTPAVAPTSSVLMPSIPVNPSLAAGMCYSPISALLVVLTPWACRPAPAVAACDQVHHTRNLALRLLPALVLAIVVWRAGSGIAPFLDRLGNVRCVRRGEVDSTKLPRRSWAPAIGLPSLPAKGSWDELVTERLKDCFARSGVRVQETSADVPFPHALLGGRIWMDPNSRIGFCLANEWFRLKKFEAVAPADRNGNGSPVYVLSEATTGEMILSVDPDRVVPEPRRRTRFLQDPGMFVDLFCADRTCPDEARRVACDLGDFVWERRKILASIESDADEFLVRMRDSGTAEPPAK